jgi:hypothetical protein
MSRKHSEPGNKQGEETVQPKRQRNQRKSLENFSAQLAEKYYTAQEAQRALGMTRDMFNHYVKQGTIQKRNIIGVQGYYLKTEIDAMRERVEYALLTVENSELVYRTANFDDLDAINRMAYLNFGELSRSPERIAARRRFLEVNPNSTFVLYNYHTLVASLDFVPLKHEAILEFREGKRGWTFPNEMIEQFEPGYRLECIIIDMMTTTNAYRAKRGYYASTLLRHFGTETLAEWGDKGVDIKSIDSCGGSELGKHILQSAGFTSLGYKTPTREMFHLDVDQYDRKTFQAYKDALEHRKNQQTNH